MSFIVPTGNFGDIFAGYAAKRMGLPIERLVIATNENDILYARVADRHVRRWRDVVATTSPSMDIQVSSNFERFLFEASGRDAACVRGKMGGLTPEPVASVSATSWCPTARVSSPSASSEADVADCIRRVKAESGYLLDPAHRLRRRCRAQDDDVASPSTSRTSRSPPRIRRSSPTPCRPSPASARPAAAPRLR